MGRQRSTGRRVLVLPDRNGEYPQRNFDFFIGILQTNTCAGFRKLYQRGADVVPEP